MLNAAFCESNSALHFKYMWWAANCWEYRSGPERRKNRRLLYKLKPFKTVYCYDHHSGLVNRETFIFYFACFLPSLNKAVQLFHPCSRFLKSIKCQVTFSVLWKFQNLHNMDQYIWICCHIWISSLKAFRKCNCYLITRSLTRIFSSHHPAFKIFFCLIQLFCCHSFYRFPTLDISWKWHWFFSTLYLWFHSSISKKDLLVATAYIN